MATPRYRHRPQRNWGARIHETTVMGMAAVVLENRWLRVTVLVGKGSDIVELLYKPADVDLVWLTAGGVRDPMSSLSTSPDLLATFADHYPGGWQEIFPNGGAPSAVERAQFGQHGEVANLPWDYAIVADHEDEVAVTFTVRTQKTPFRIEKTLRLASDATLRLHEAVTNESDLPLPAMWGHHLTFGGPFLAPGDRVRLPNGLRVIPHDGPVGSDPRRAAGAEGTWPTIPGPDGATVDLSTLPPRGTPSELVYLHGFGDEGAYSVESTRHGLTCTIGWDARVMPYCWYWQEFGAITGYPWYGRHWNIGLEPFSSFPTDGLAAAIDNGTAMTLAPRERRENWLTVTVGEIGAGS
ncbi:MAG: aldose 1-epimerase [Thermomicrobiales bacterium]